jgi:hypothetical protein
VHLGVVKKRNQSGVSPRRARWGPLRSWSESATPCLTRYGRGAPVSPPALRRWCSVRAARPSRWALTRRWSVRGVRHDLERPALALGRQALRRRAIPRRRRCRDRLAIALVRRHRCVPRSVAPSLRSAEHRSPATDAWDRRDQPREEGDELHGPLALGHAVAPGTALEGERTEAVALPAARAQTRGRSIRRRPRGRGILDARCFSSTVVRARATTRAAGERSGWSP